MLSTPKAKAELYLASSLYDGLEDNNIMQITTLLLNKEADPNVLIPSQGITPFHLVIGNDSETFAEEVTKLFLRHGGNPNIKSVDGMTPVHVAAAWGRLGVLELLLANGGDPLLLDDDGRSPFHYAFDEAHYDAVATLGKYCGEFLEEDSDPKYNIALDKILVSNRGMVAEYAVSEDTSATGSDAPVIRTSKVSNNNNELLKNLNQPYFDSVKTENRGSEWRCKNPGNINFPITTTGDESSISSTFPKSENIKRYRRCLPRRNLKQVESKLKDKEKIDRDLPKENIPALDNLLSMSHLNDTKIEASFVVEPQKAGENMPRISSPKNEKNIIKSEEVICRNAKSTKTTLSDAKKTPSRNNKFVHKTPLRSSSNVKPLVEMKRTPNPTSAKKLTTTPKNGAVMRTPNRYICKKAYSPDCSIISKSPNLIIGPVTTPRNNYKIIEERKKFCVASAGIPSSRNLKKIPAYDNRSKTPTPDKIHYNVNSGKKFSRFVKQSDLRHQDMKKTPLSSPRKYRPINQTDSTKRKNKFSSGKKQTPVHSASRSPATPLNKTYNKKEYFGLSPEAENTNRFIDRRTLDRNIAIKLEETMFDDDCEKSIAKVSRTASETTVDSLSSDPVQRKTSNIAENRLNSPKKSRNLDRLISTKPFQISGVNMITDWTQTSESEGRTVSWSQRYNKARGSIIIAGFFQPNSVDANSFRISDREDILNNVIMPQICRRYSNLFGINSAANKISEDLTAPGIKNLENNEKGMYACVRLPNSKEIDDSLVSSEFSNYSLDHCTSFSNSRDTGVSAGPEDSSKEKTPRTKSELSSPRLTEDRNPLDDGRTSSAFPNTSSSISTSSYASFVSVEEEYKYEDAEEGIILLERRLLTTPVSFPIIKPEEGVASPSERSSQRGDDESMESCVSSLPHSLIIMDSETLRKELTRLDSRPPGPITTTTRHVYLRRLRKLQKYGPPPTSATIAVPPKFSSEIERTLRSETWMTDLSTYEILEQQVFSEFSSPDPTRRWREGTTKSSFNYLLMDPRITENLPRRANTLPPIECWRIFLSAIFYVGKGRRSRPYAHLYEAYSEWKKGKREISDNKKVNCILDVWKSNCGVVCLHFFQNVIPVEAYTREAAMIEALGLDRLGNSKSGDYYGVAATWSHHQKRTLGVYLLYKAMHILINEGERQLSPDDIGR